MGIYHFMGVGRSVGAVTAALSYMAACREKGGQVAERMFGRSGEISEGKHRGSIQSLVLFGTDRIRLGIDKCSEYMDNAAGHPTGNLVSSCNLINALRKASKKDLEILARREVGKDRQSSGVMSVEFYWCDIVLNDPLVTFERVVYALSAAKASGGSGKEIWINLTGGNNIHNAALQMAASLLGTPARIYYLLSSDPRCVRHTTRPSELGTEKDHFWVNLPLVYLKFSPLQRHILEEIETCPGQQIDLEQLFNLLRADPEMKAELENIGIQQQQDFLRLVVLPLYGQGLIIRREGFPLRLGESAQYLKDYFSVMSSVQYFSPRSLGELAKDKGAWFHSMEDLLGN